MAKRKPLKSVLFRSNARIGRAATTAHASLKEGVTDDAVRILILAMANIELRQDSLPPKLQAKKATSANLGTRTWGRFFNDRSEFESRRFGGFTKLDVAAFQEEAGDLTVDGEAGIGTLHRMDEIIAVLEAVFPLVDLDPNAIPRVLSL